MKVYHTSQTTDAHSEQIPVDLGLVTACGQAIEPISEIESLRVARQIVEAWRTNRYLPSPIFDPLVEVFAGALRAERARCARIADAVAADFCADPDLPSGCQAARTIADAIRSGEAAPSELATQCAELVRGLCCELSDGVLEMAVESLGRTNVEVIRRKRDAVLSALPDAVSQPQTSR